MKKVLIITALALGLSALRVTAEDAAPGRKGAGGAGQHERVPPSVRCDKNGDGVIDATERPQNLGKRGKGGDGQGKGGPGKGGEGRGKGGPGDGGAGKGKGGPGAGGRGR